ncbi:MAG: hypothetical protein J6P61_07765 [Erysipelotrichaceae bacterium]|nr:hypothetical protein [Erysipelotrichaceae bacterium]
MDLASMNNLMNILSVIAGVYLLVAGYMLLRHEKLEVLFDRSIRKTIPKKYHAAYAHDNGKVMLGLGTVLIVTNILFYVLDGIYYTFTDIVLIITLVVAIILLSRIGKKYSK